MIVRLRDATEKIINKERGEKLEALLLSGECPEYIKIDDLVVRKDYIVCLKPGGYTESDLVDQTHRIEAPDYRGRDSKAKEELRKRFGKQ